MEIKQLTPQEEQLMQIVWQSGNGFIKDYREKYPEPQPPYTTVATIMKKLEKKGYVNARMYGNTYEYSAAIREEEYKSRYISGLVSDYFKNSYKEMVSFFAAEEKLSEKDLEEIIDMIRKRK